MYQIMNQADGSLEITLYDEIYRGYTANKIINQLKEANPENITLRINSQGGEVFEGIALHNYLKDRNVTVIVDGLCASSASIIAMAGKKIIMNEGTLMMIHNPITLAFGDAEDLRDVALVLEKLTNQLANIYESRSVLNHDEILSLMDKETWLTPAEALEYGFCDEIQEAEPKDSEPPAKEESVSNSAKKNAYEEGILAERERLKALDDLYAPGREAVINEAKYKTFASAPETAIRLLKAESIRPINTGVNNFPVKGAVNHAVDDMIEIINRKRGYTNGR